MKSNTPVPAVGTQVVVKHEERLGEFAGMVGLFESYSGYEAIVIFNAYPEGHSRRKFRMNITDLEALEQIEQTRGVVAGWDCPFCGATTDEECNPNCISVVNPILAAELDADNIHVWPLETV